MSTKPRTAVHATTVSRVLADAHHVKAATMGTRVRGIRHTYAGFSVTKPEPFQGAEGTLVFVTYTAEDGAHRHTTIAERVAKHETMLARYERTLLAAGFATETTESATAAPFDLLRVTIGQ